MTSGWMSKLQLIVTIWHRDNKVDSARMYYKRKKEVCLSAHVNLFVTQETMSHAQNILLRQKVAEQQQQIATLQAQQTCQNCSALQQ